MKIQNHVMNSDAAVCVQKCDQLSLRTFRKIYIYKYINKREKGYMTE